jgi:hypothetical protein
MAYGIKISGTYNYFAQTGALLTIPPPKGSYVEAAEARDLASGGTRWVGDPRIRWHWDYIEREWHDILRAIFPGSSGVTYIISTINDNDDEFREFSARYKWPLELEKDMHRRIDFEIEFRRALLYPVVALDTAEAIVNGQQLTVVIT